MHHTIAQKLLLGLTTALVLAACGGGEEQIRWPQSVALTDFTGQSRYFLLGGSYYAQIDCRTCITLYGVARSNVELGNILPEQKTFEAWPAPYNDKLFAALPIDYSSKMAVVLEDLESGAYYNYFMQKAEETEEAVTITVLKCMVGDVYVNGATVKLGLLLPKTNKPIKVLTVQSGKPTLPEYLPNGLGAC